MRGTTTRERPAGQRASPGGTAQTGSEVHDGLYVRVGRPLVRLVLLVVALPPALVISLPIVAVNAFLFRSLRRVLFTQERVGRAGRVFWIVKFRTMREVPASAYDSWTSGLDRLRVTSFGRFLRNTHLDELPQLVNILRGEMDFIGPRPEMVAIHDWACEHVPGFALRNALLPGVTGLAQVIQGYAGRDEAQYRRKLALDLEYLERLSLATDLEILSRTALWMARGKGWQQVPRPRTEPGSG